LLFSFHPDQALALGCPSFKDGLAGRFEVIRQQAFKFANHVPNEPLS
jgi:hypothetical protein